MTDRQTALTPAQKLRVAVAVLLEGMDQHRVAALMGVNPARVNVACKAIAAAAGLEQPRDLDHTPDPMLDFDGRPDGARLLMDRAPPP